MRAFAHSLWWAKATLTAGLGIVAASAGLLASALGGARRLDIGDEAGAATIDERG